MRIVNYDLRWNANSDQNQIWVKLETGKSIQVPVSSTQEFVAVSLILATGQADLHEDGTLEAKV